MRIISGSAKGRRLRSIRGEDIRPTPDRVRESVFNVIRGRIPGSRGLDLFAGSGGIGIEALSRGADFVCFVDSRKEAVRLIRENLSICGFSEDGPAGYRTLISDYSSVLGRLKAEGFLFDWIYVDPPYDLDVYEQVLLRISESRLLTPDGLVLLEHFHKRELPSRVGTFSAFRDLRYGSTGVRLYKNESAGEFSNEGNRYK